MNQYSVIGSDGLIDIAKSKEAYTQALIEWSKNNSMKDESFSQSDQLSKTITDNPIASEEAKDKEKEVVLATKKAVAKLKEAYPELNLSIEKKLFKADINNKLVNSCPSNQEECY